MPNWLDSLGTQVGGYLKDNYTSDMLPKSPYSPTTQAGQWWGQAPFYLEKSFLNMMDRGSGLYQDFQQDLMKTLGGQFSANSLLSAGMGRGGGYGSSQFLANEQMKQMQGRASDYAVEATDKFYTGMQGQAQSLLELMFGDRWKQGEFDVTRGSKTYKEGGE